MAKTNRLKQTNKDGLSYKSIFHGTSSMPDGVYRYFSWETRKKEVLERSQSSDIQIIAMTVGRNSTDL